jgi:hypothetical protein
LPARRTADYIRIRTTTLVAALNIVTGQVTGLRQPRRRTRSSCGFCAR